MSVTIYAPVNLTPELEPDAQEHFTTADLRVINIPVAPSTEAIGLIWVDRVVQTRNDLTLILAGAFIGAVFGLGVERLVQAFV